MLSNIKKLYISHFLIGLVFWYGIEKLFITSIGIDAAGIGFITAMFLTFNLVFDIPCGMLADKWSRKWMLCIACVGMALAAVVMGGAHSLPILALGYISYGVYVCCTDGVYQAIIYDSLHQEGRSEDYSKINGRMGALFLTGASVANVVSGFLAAHTSYSFVYFISVVPCVLNILIISTIKEPKFHKAEAKERMLRQIKDVTKNIVKVRALRVLVLVFSGLTVIELFKSEFGQLYMLRYVSSAELLGILWAGYSLAWALGSLIAHKLHARLSLLIWLSVIPYFFMAFIDTGLGIVLFVVQAVASAAMYNETRIQDVTASAVRASVLSVLNALERLISIPSALLIGWVIRDYNIFWVVRGVAIVCAVMLAFWLSSGRKIHNEVPAT